MARKGLLIVLSILYLVTLSICGEVRVDEKENSKGDEKKKPNILKDYICLRDGELCHPEFGKNRGLYVSCSNGVAWEQSCPKCTYHAIACPTKSLWFDGEKCEWASPKLASQPCIDKIPIYEVNKEQGGSAPVNVMSEQEALFQSLQASPMPPAPMPPQNPQAEKNKWPGNPMNNPGQGYFKSPKSGALDNEPSQFIDAHNFELKEDDLEKEDDHEQSSDNHDAMENQRKSDENDSEFPYLGPEEGKVGSKIVKLNEPVYALVNSPSGAGKQVLMRVFQPFVLEDQARGLLPSIFSKE